MKKRSLLLMLAAGMLLTTGGLVSCDPAEQSGEENTLSVKPSGALEFDAEDNDAVILTITTDAADGWKATPSADCIDWVTTVRSGDKLTVNVDDNDGEERTGKLTITAGTAKAVNIMITQAEGTPVAEGTVAGTFLDTDGGKGKTFTMETASIEAVAYFSIAERADADVSVALTYDNAYLAEYNFANDANCKLFPKSLISYSNGGNAVVPAGSKISNDVKITLAFDETQLEYNVDYLVPLTVTPNSKNVTVKSKDSRVNYIVKRKNPKAVKNFLYFEVNDTNPLNALEYIMEDGQYFFDAVVLFAANINYNAGEDVVYLHQNANVEVLLDNSDKFLQPLRKKGIKVYLGLLGNHDAAGIAQLSDWGCQQYAQTLANACQVYQLDGVNFDDEYSSSPGSGKWFASKSTARAARLCYETKKALKATCPWETEVSIFSYGSCNTGMPDVTVDGVTTKAGDFVDIAVANYGGSAGSMSGWTDKSHQSYMSVELNRGSGTATEASGKAAKDGGYGWYMWFALDWAQTTSFGKLNSVCKGMYDGKELKPVEGYYKWVKDGGPVLNANSDQRYSKATNQPIN